MHKHGASFGFVGGQAGYDFLIASICSLQFFVGMCMFITVTWLLRYRMQEIRECWKIHARIRYYFGLTALATVVNLAIGICGTLFIAFGPE